MVVAQRPTNASPDASNLKYRDRTAPTLHSARRQIAMMLGPATQPVLTAFAAPLRMPCAVRFLRLVPGVRPAASWIV
eukprot:SAG22_NODE_1251_length_5005_cov_22.891154_1_plen_77_part_00